jgi:hypothetical protein
VSVVTKARLFCTPASKFIAGGNGDDPRGTALDTDFTCYKVQCPPNPNQRVEIDDQFGDRDIGIKNAQMLCTPTVALVPGSSGVASAPLLGAPPRPQVSTIPGKIRFKTAAGQRFAYFKPTAKPFQTEPDVTLGEPLINACEDLNGVSVDVGCTMGALSCTCTATLSNCVENVSGNCECDYTLNPTARNCH